MKTRVITILLVLFATITNAQQWQNVTPVGYTYFITNSFINNKEGWSLAVNGYWNNYDLLHTIDGATTFVPIFTFPDNLRSENMQMVDSLNGFAKITMISGNDVYLWKTSDGGYNWQDITDSTLFMIGGPLHSGYGFFFRDKDIGFYGGLNSIYKTVDGGLLWNKMNTPSIIDSSSSNI